MKLLSSVVVSSVLFLLLLLAGCADYYSERDVKSIPNLNSGMLIFPDDTFTYYKQDALRSNIYIIYFKDRSFLDLNESDVVLVMEGVVVDPNQSINFIAHFESSALLPPFDFELLYDYYEVDSGDSSVFADALVNDEHNIYLLRIVNLKGDPAER